MEIGRGSGARWIVALMVLLLVSPARAEDLSQAWDIALRNSHQLRASSEQVNAAEETLAAARASRLPSWNNTGGYVVLNHEVSYNARDLAIVGPVSIPFLQGDFFAGLSLVTLPLYTSGRIRSTIGAAGASVQAAAADEGRAVLDLKMAVAEAYVAVLYAQQIVKVAEAGVTNLEAHLTVALDLVKQEVRPPADALAARVQLADARLRALDARNQLEIARATYNRLLGRCLTDPVALEELSPEPFGEDVCALTTQAIDRRPELSALQKQEEGLNLQSDAVRSETKPQVGLSGGYAYLKDQYLTHNGYWVAGVAVKWNLDCGITKHRANSLKHQAYAVAAQRSELESGVALQVRRAWLDVQTERERMEVTKLSIEQAEENLRVARSRYMNKVGTSTEVLDALTLRTRSFGNYYNAVYNAVLSVLRLHRAVGDL